jgi:hypothetical protein
VIIHCRTIGESTFAGRQQGIAQHNSCALTLKLSHGCFPASIRTVIREVYWKCGIADGSGELVKTKKSHFKGLSAVREAQQKRREREHSPLTTSSIMEALLIILLQAL